MRGGSRGALRGCPRHTLRARWVLLSLTSPLLAPRPPRARQLRAFAGREAASLGAALTFKHVLCLALGSLVGWLFVGLWTKFVVLLLLPMLLKLYRDRNRQEVQDGLDQLGRSVPSRLSMGAGAVSRLAAHGARMAMDLDLDFFSPASKRAAKRA